MVHLTILLVARIVQGQKVGRSVSNELERMWKETALFQLDSYVYTTSFAQRHSEVQYACPATRPKLEPVLPEYEA